MFLAAGQFASVRFGCQWLGGHDGVVKHDMAKISLSASLQQVTTRSNALPGTDGMT